MDLNYVFLRQQVERSLAEAAESAAERCAHEALARAYEEQIERKSGGRIVFPWHQCGHGCPENPMEASLISSGPS